eukprot:gene27131-2360_t
MLENKRRRGAQLRGSVGVEQRAGKSKKRKINAAIPRQILKKRDFFCPVSRFSCEVRDGLRVGGVVSPGPERESNTHAGRRPVLLGATLVPPRHKTPAQPLPWKNTSE